MSTNTLITINLGTPDYNSFSVEDLRTLLTALEIECASDSGPSEKDVLIAKLTDKNVVCAECIA